MFTLYAFNGDQTLLNPEGTVIECDHLPRVGEMISVSEDWVGEEYNGQFLAFDVYHAVVDGQMFSYVQAIAAEEEYRLPILRSRSWLPEADEQAG